eukprot:gene20291-31727_t
MADTTASSHVERARGAHGDTTAAAVADGGSSSSPTNGGSTGPTKLEVVTEVLLDLLPSELLVCSLSFLHVDDLLRVRAVCKTLKTLVDGNVKSVLRLE